MAPEEEQEELSLIYQAKGFRKADADDLADRLLSEPGIALDSLIREELGLDPQSLGSPIGAALSSLLTFAFGAALPVIPFLFGSSTALVAVSVTLSATAIFGVGAFLSIFTGKGLFISGLRQLMIGAVAAAVTFGVGTIIGVSTG